MRVARLASHVRPVSPCWGGFWLNRGRQQLGDGCLGALFLSE